MSSSIINLKTSLKTIKTPEIISELDKDKKLVKDFKAFIAHKTSNKKQKVENTHEYFQDDSSDDDYLYAGIVANFNMGNDSDEEESSINQGSVMPLREDIHDHVQFATIIVFNQDIILQNMKLYVSKVKKKSTNF